MKPDQLYCIQHGRMEFVKYGEITGLPAHEVFYPFEPYEVGWCEGPFASCPPPDVENWDVLFADEEGIQDMLDFMYQEDAGGMS